MLGKAHKMGYADIIIGISQVNAERRRPLNTMVSVS